MKAGIVGDFLARQKQHLLRRQQKSAEMLNEMKRQQKTKRVATGPPKMLGRASIAPPGQADDDGAAAADGPGPTPAEGALPNLASPSAARAATPTSAPGSPRAATPSARAGGSDGGGGGGSASRPATPGSPAAGSGGDEATQPRPPTSGRKSSTPSSKLRPGSRGGDMVSSSGRLSSPSKSPRPPVSRGMVKDGVCTCASLHCDHPSHRKTEPRKTFKLSSTSRRKLERQVSIRKLIEQAATRKKIFTICGRVGALPDVRTELLARGWVEKPPPREGDPYTHHEAPDGTLTLSPACALPFASPSLPPSLSLSLSLSLCARNRVC